MFVKLYFIAMAAGLGTWVAVVHGVVALAPWIGGTGPAGWPQWGGLQ